MNQTPRQAKAMFEALALPCLNDLGRFALSLTHNQMDAEDLVQSTYCRALEKFQTFDGRNIRSWLSSILYSLFINSCRRKKLEGRAMVSREFSQSNNGSGTVRDPLDSLEVIETVGAKENQAVSKLACDDIQRAIDALPNEFRTVIVLREQNDLSYKEIASVLGCPAGTVMSRLNRGRKLLQEMLRDQAEELGIPVPPKKAKATNEAAGSTAQSGHVFDHTSESVAAGSVTSGDQMNTPMDLNAYRQRRRKLG